jgi:tryptophan synthase alpha chain
VVEAGLGAGERRLGEAFAAGEGRAALMPYLMGGFPSLEGSLAVGRAYAQHADVVELGVPFSDPLADGPVIQAAGQRALAAGTTLERTLEEVARPLAELVPVVLMCYVNQLLAFGLDDAPRAMSAHGVSGLIAPDLPADEADDLRHVCDEAGVALVPLVAPTTTPARIDLAATAARGFVYVVSVTGVTGERAALPERLTDVIARVQGAATVPVAVGFGIGTPEQAALVGEVADGVIIGSRLVRAVADAESLEEGLADVTAFLADTRAALSRSPS